MQRRRLTDVPLLCIDNHEVIQIVRVNCRDSVQEDILSDYETQRTAYILGLHVPHY